METHSHLKKQVKYHKNNDLKSKKPPKNKQKKHKKQQKHNTKLQVNGTKKEMDNLTEAKRQIDALPKVLKEDFRILFKFNCEYKDAKTILFPKLINLIEEAYGLPESPPKIITQKWSKGNGNNPHKLYLGFTAPESNQHTNDDCNDVITEENSSNDEECLQGLVVGPESSRITEAKRFRAVWAGGDENKQKRMCQLRRFQDGTIKETVTIKISSWGAYANDFILDKIVHLVSVHFDNVEAQILRGFKMESPCYNSISGAYKASKRNKQMRQIINSFVSILSEISTPELPIRKVTVATSCLHSGDESNHIQHKTLNIPNHFWIKRDSSLDDGGKTHGFEHQIAEKSKCMPMICKPIPVLMDITVKKSFSSELFTRLAQMHLIQLSHHLQSQNKLKSVMHNGQLIVEYDDTIFGITVQEPSKTSSETQNMNSKISYDHSSIEGLHERLRTVSSRHSSWWGAEKLVHLWIRKNYLESTFPEMIADLLLGAILDGTVEVVNSKKTGNLFQTDLLPPASIESAFTRFLYHLSFADFDKTLYCLDKPECHNVHSTIASFEMLKQKNHLPPITIITPYDQTISGFTKQLSDQSSLCRIVNCARHSLQQILNMASTEQFYRFDDLFNSIPQMCLKTYDAVIDLKPLAKYHRTSKTESDENCSSSLPHWNVIRELIVELESAFLVEDNVMFHYNPEEHNIGVKVLKNLDEDTADLSMLIEDIMIIGKGLIHDVRPLQSNDTVVTME